MDRLDHETPPVEECAKSHLMERMRSPKLIIALALILAAIIAIAYSSGMNLLARSEYKQARAYTDGDGVGKSMEDAAKWYRKSAEHGYAKAQYKLGSCYASGEGVQRDMQEAAKWWGKAAKQGYAHAKDALKKSGVAN